MKYEFVCQEKTSLIKFIANKMPQINFLQIKTSLRKKDVRVNNSKTKDDIVLKQGDLITIFLPDKKEDVIEKVYEDDNILVCFKPCGMETTLKDKTFDSKSLEECVNLTALHRLDKNTEGLVIFAKNDSVIDDFVFAFKNQYVHKYYKALVWGRMPKQHDVLNAYLTKDAQNSLVVITDHPQKNSIPITTEYLLLNQFENTALLEVKITAGKTHQIRAHLSHINHSIVGDNKYGNKQNNKKFGASKQCLTAYKLNFDFPIGSKYEYLNPVEIIHEPTWKTPTR